MTENLNIILGSLDRDPDQQRTEADYDRWIADDACQVCYAQDATCSAFGKRTCERCQDEVHRYACKYPRHPKHEHSFLAEELERCLENEGESRAEYGSGAVSLGYSSDQALIGFDPTPWLEAEKELRSTLSLIEAWLARHGCVKCGTEDAGRFDATNSSGLCVDCYFGECQDARAQQLAANDDIPF